MRSLISTSALAAVAAFALAPTTALAVPFSNPVAGGLASGASSDVNTGTFSADDFVLGIDSKITSIVWYGNVTDFADDGVLPDDFQVDFFVNDGGFPGATIATFVGGDLAVSTSPSGLLDASDAEILEYSASIDGPELDAGVIYWVGIQNFLEDPDPGLDGDEWVWALSGDSGDYFFDDGAASVSVQGTNNLAFSLDGEALVAVSEPGALSLLGFGLMGVAYAGRRRH